jgi:hypothetical protein
MAPHLIELTERSALTAESLSREFGFTSKVAMVEAALEHFLTRMRDPEFRRERLRELVLESVQAYENGEYVEVRSEAELHRVLDEARDRARDRSAS